MPQTSLIERHRANAAAADWLAALDAADPAGPDVAWPDEREFIERLRYVAVPEDDIAILATRYPEVSANEDLRWIVDRYVRLLRSRMDLPGYEELPPPPDTLGEIGPHLFTVVHMAILPETLALHRGRGIPDHVSRATLADIGRHYVIERAVQGRSGLNSGGDWLTLHTRGVIYQLGRLQFERALQGNRTSQGIRAAGVSSEKGDPVLAVHIPGYSGGFPPHAIDDSFDQARAFFPAHYPEERYQLAVCHSWLLDPQLAGYLPETSNIVQFQRRFREAYRSDEPNNDHTLNFVFRSPGTPLDDLPQNTTLERAVVRHIRDGKSWRLGHGWLEF